MLYQTTQYNQIITGIKLKKQNFKYSIKKQFLIKNPIKRYLHLKEY